MALILPILLILLMGLLDLGRLYFAYVAVTDAAGEGAAQAAINPTDGDAIFQRAQFASGGLVVLEAGSVITACETVSAGYPITVTVDYTHTLATPVLRVIVPEGTLLLRAVATQAIRAGALGP